MSARRTVNVSEKSTLNNRLPAKVIKRRLKTTIAAVKMLSALILFDVLCGFLIQIIISTIGYIDKINIDEINAVKDKFKTDLNKVVKTKYSTATSKNTISAEHKFIRFINREPVCTFLFLFEMRSLYPSFTAFCVRSP